MKGVLMLDSSLKPRLCAASQGCPFTANLLLSLNPL
jgi:hypothetical protein